MLTGLRGVRPAKAEHYGGTMDGIGTLRIAHPYEGLEKGIHHLKIREGNGSLQSQIPGMGKAAHQKSCQPPVLSAVAEQ